MGGCSREPLPAECWDLIWGLLQLHPRTPGPAAGGRALLDAAHHILTLQHHRAQCCARWGADPGCGRWAAPQHLSTPPLQSIAGRVPASSALGQRGARRRLKSPEGCSCSCTMAPLREPLLRHLSAWSPAGDKVRAVLSWAAPITVLHVAHQECAGALLGQLRVGGWTGWRPDKLLILWSHRCGRLCAGRGQPA